MQLSDFVRRLRANEQDTPGSVEASHTLEPRPPRMEPIGDWLCQPLRRALEARGILELYCHQREAADLLHRGRDTVIATSTASGKSLCYHLPVLNALLEDGLDARALYLYPTKALSRDQMQDVEQLLAESAHSRAEDLTIAVYDGDTPPGTRSALRERGSLVLTNPHMLHTGILPNHTRWQGLFTGLRYVVVDELHTLSGIYGNHFNRIKWAL